VKDPSNSTLFATRKRNKVGRSLPENPAATEKFTSLKLLRFVGCGVRVKHRISRDEVYLANKKRAELGRHFLMECQRSHVTLRVSWDLRPQSLPTQQMQTQHIQNLLGRTLPKNVRVTSESTTGNGRPSVGGETNEDFLIHAGS